MCGNLLQCVKLCRQNTKSRRSFYGGLGPSISFFNFCFPVSSMTHFKQVVSLDVIGEDLNELQRRRTIIQRVSCHLFQTIRVAFPCNLGERSDIAFDRFGVQAMFFCDYSIDLLVNCLNVVRSFKDDFDSPNQLWIACVTLCDAKGSQKITQNIFHIQGYSYLLFHSQSTRPCIIITQKMKKFSFV